MNLLERNRINTEFVVKGLPASISAGGRYLWYKGVKIPLTQQNLHYLPLGVLEVLYPPPEYGFEDEWCPFSPEGEK
jgi:hypothetical protein